MHMNIDLESNTIVKEAFHFLQSIYGHRSHIFLKEYSPTCDWSWTRSFKFCVGENNGYQGGGQNVNRAPLFASIGSHHVVVHTL